MSNAWITQDLEISKSIIEQISKASAQIRFHGEDGEPRLIHKESLNNSNSGMPVLVYTSHIDKLPLGVSGLRCMRWILHDHKTVVSVQFPEDEDRFADFLNAWREYGIYMSQLQTATFPVSPAGRLYRFGVTGYAFDQKHRLHDAVSFGSVPVMMAAHECVQRRSLESKRFTNHDDRIQAHANKFTITCELDKDGTFAISAPDTKLSVYNLLVKEDELPGLIRNGHADVDFSADALSMCRIQAAFDMFLFKCS